MRKLGRNAPCPCGSGKKYKGCCEGKESAMRKKPLPRGRFRYEPGSYGGPGQYVPSLLCYKETTADSWEEYYCLVKPDACFDDEEPAVEMATRHLGDAFAAKEAGGSAADLAIFLRHAGYTKVDGFRVIDGEPTEEV